ncbi:MAG: phage shock protein operon transcriptional activator [Gammaproteobacteria bacterium]|nr:phage shock protein operon transcriptional activator [Gammaproteobacteria bacterium]NNC97772.1 phage shock protein operon transcriptional activator [Gammaproteobacteria bacterium]NNM14297.1 phage shock protein operon transcriptional activator [Gammaproteobacteria bacterium]
MELNTSERSQAIGESPAFLATLEQASKVAPLSKPVLIIGERGTGKELIATRLHYLSPRWEQPFIKLNCSSLTETLLESELFGHEAGAFTGAVKQHIGRFERADGGTLFLDELATIPKRMQEKILRVIEYGEFERVGGSKTINVSVRIVAATNANLPELAKQGSFRADLLDRLAFDVINLPALRYRQMDILLLADFYAINMVRELGWPYFPGFSQDAQQALLNYTWPGNIRELRNVVERSLYRSDWTEEPIDSIRFNPFKSEYIHRFDAISEPQKSLRQTISPTEQIDVTALQTPLKQAVATLEVQMIGLAMQESKHNQAQAAKLLGLSYHQLRALLKKHDLLKTYGRKN